MESTRSISLRPLGSIELETPLRMDHDVGVTVAVVQGNAAPRIHTGEAAGDHDSAADEGESYVESSGDTVTSFKIEKVGKTIEIPKPMLTLRIQVAKWSQELGDRILEGSSRLDDKEKKYYAACLRLDIDRSTPNTSTACQNAWSEPIGG